MEKFIQEVKEHFKKGIELIEEFESKLISPTVPEGSLPESEATTDASTEAPVETPAE